MNPNMTPNEIRSVLTNKESERVEFTTSTSDYDKFSKAICAFCNDIASSGEPWFLLIGVNDDGTPSGAKITEQLIQSVADIRSQGNIQPLPNLRGHRKITFMFMQDTFASFLKVF